MAGKTQPPFRYPNQDGDDLELLEEVAMRRADWQAALVLTAYGTPHPHSPEHRLVSQEPVIGRDGEVTVRRVYRKLPGAVLTGEVVKDATWGARAEVRVQDVAPGTPADEGLNVTESVVEAKDGQMARKRTTEVEAWPVLISRRLNARGDVETVTQERVAPETPLPPGTLTAEARVEAETQHRSRLTRHEVDSHCELDELARGDHLQIPARLRALDVLKTTESIVAPGTFPDPLGDGVVASKVAGKSRHQSIKRTVRREDGVLPEAVDYKIGSDGELLETRESLVPDGTLPTGGFGVVSDVVRETGAGYAVRQRTQLASGEAYPVLVNRAVDAETQVAIRTERYVVVAGSSFLMGDPLVVDQKIQAVDRWRSLHFITRLESLPPAHQFRKQVSFNFPGLFYGYDALPSGTVYSRRAFTRTVEAVVEISYGYGEVPLNILEIITASWSYPRSLSGGNLLTNQETYTFPVQGDPYTWTLPHTTPTRTAYEAMIGQYAVVGGNSVRWKGGVWRTERVKVKLL